MFFDATLIGQVSTLIADMAGQPTSRILDALRSLERKTGLVFTFFKASVYAMVVRFNCPTCAFLYTIVVTIRR
jgi:DASH complex subunit Dad3